MVAIGASELVKADSASMKSIANPVRLVLVKTDRNPCE